MGEGFDWGEWGSSLARKGAFLGDLPLEEGEWEKWVGTFSPHTPVVWQSHFPSLLIWYASDEDGLCANLRSVMWGVGANEYPITWWRGALQSLYLKAALKRVAT